jgi:hypothetical protein
VHISLVLNSQTQRLHTQKYGRQGNDRGKVAHVLKKIFTPWRHMKRGDYLHIFLTSELDGGKGYVPAALSYRKNFQTVTGQKARWTPKCCGERNKMYYFCLGSEPRFFNCPTRSL